MLGTVQWYFLIIVTLIYLIATRLFFNAANNLYDINYHFEDNSKKAT